MIPLDFIYAISNICDLNKLPARVNSCIYICGMYVFQAEKADGFVNLPDFTVERASECKKKQ